jgi:hypothetical protein
MFGFPLPSLAAIVAQSRARFDGPRFLVGFVEVFDARENGVGESGCEF